MLALPGRRSFCRARVLRPGLDFVREQFAQVAPECGCGACRLRGRWPPPAVHPFAQLAGMDFGSSCNPVGGVATRSCSSQLEDQALVQVDRALRQDRDHGNQADGLRATPQTRPALLVEVMPHTLRHPDESCRDLVLPSPGDASYMPVSAWDVGDLQGALDDISVDGGDQQRRHDLLVKIGVHGDRTLRYPKAGVAFTCEACRARDRIFGQSGPRIAPVPWARFPDADGVVDAMRAVSTDVGDRLLVIAHGDGWAGYRPTVVCARCARTHNGKRGLQRCWNEDPPEESSGWRRCDEIANGRDFCVHHASRSARHARETGRARRAATLVPELKDRGILAEIRAMSPKLIRVAEERAAKRRGR
jgi:hypothetical protein